MTLVAIGNALLDTEFLVNEDILSCTNLTKGAMTLADTDEQLALFEPRQ